MRDDETELVYNSGAIQRKHEDVIKCKQLLCNGGIGTDAVIWIHP